MESVGVVGQGQAAAAAGGQAEAVTAGGQAAAFAQAAGRQPQRGWPGPREPHVAIQVRAEQQQQPERWAR
eukprot:11076291-Alexandrium_andersonii.AAC.1